MAAARSKASLTVRDVRALNWPTPVRTKGTPLSVTDCYKVGEIILEELHWTETRGRQDWSLRRLQSQVLKVASVSTLSRCVRVYRIAKELSLTPPWNNLDMRHFVATASLPASKRKQLLNKVERHGWSVTQLEQFVRENYGSPGRGGKSTAECVRALEYLESRDLFSDLNRLKVYSRAELRRLATRIERAEKQLKQLKKQVTGLTS